MSSEEALRVQPDPESAETGDAPDQPDKSLKPDSRASKDVAAAFGDIVSLLVSSPAHKHFFLADLEWLVLPPLLLRQCQVIYSKKRPVAVAFWAFVSEQVEKELEAGRQRLRPHEWKSGDRLWLVELISPTAYTDGALMENLMSKLGSTAPMEVFKYRQFGLGAERVEVLTYSRSKSDG